MKKDNYHDEDGDNGCHNEDGDDGDDDGDDGDEDEDYLEWEVDGAVHNSAVPYPTRSRTVASTLSQQLF